MVPVEVIQSETVRRLYFGHELSLGEIDATEVLPLLRASNREGLIYNTTQRCVAFSIRISYLVMCLFD